MFKTNFSVDSKGLQNYYRDLAKRMKTKEIDLLIVVGMFLTGFDAPTLNTLFVDKNLRYHGLIQAFSRTNRIYDATKTFGNIVTFRDLEMATVDAITLYGDKNTKNVVLEKSYKEYMEGFIDMVTGEARRGFMDVVFEIDLLKSQEINLDYILELIFEHNKKIKSKAELVDEVRRVIRASLGNRAKESLIVDFINQTDLDQIGEKSGVIEAFFSFAQAEQQREADELINAESLNAEEARRYITSSLKREYASDAGTELNAILPKMSPLNPQYLTKKQSVFLKIAAFVDKFKGVGGTV